MANRTIILGSDPWASELHQHLAAWLAGQGHRVVSVNDPAGAGVPYYEVARRVGLEVLAAEGSAGIVMCGTGMGVAMVANSLPGIDCAVCENALAAHRARAFNNANVLALGAYFTTPYVARIIVSTFLGTPFGDGVDSDRAAEIARWHAEVRAMEKRIARDDWFTRCAPAEVPPVATEADAATPPA